MSTPLHTPSTTGRRGTGAPLGVNLLSRIATLREEGRLPIRSIQWYLCTVHQLRLSVGAIVIHQTAQQAQPAVAAILDRIRASPVVHADETGWRQNGNNGYVWTFSTPTERYFLRTLLPAAGSGQGGGGRSAGRVILRSTGQRLLRRLPPLRWPQATVLGPPVAGYPRPGGTLPQGHRAGPVGRGSPSALCRGQVYVEARSMSRPGLSPILRHNDGAPLNWPGSGSCWSSASPSWLTRSSAGPAVPAHRAPHQGTLRLRGRTGRAVGQQPRRAQPAPCGYQPQDQRGHPVGTWYREQDDAGIHLRHLARTRPEPPRRLPPTAHFPSNLNSYFSRTPGMT